MAKQITTQQLIADPAEWLVEIVRHDDDGQIERTIFQGADAEARARAYAVSQEQAA